MNFDFVKFLDLLNPEYWPLLISVAFFYYIKKENGLDHYETWQYWLARHVFGWGAVSPFILPILTTLNFSHSNLLNVILLAAGAALIVESFIHRKPPELPDDKIVVTIANFESLGASDKDQGTLFARRVERELAEKSAPIIVKRFNKSAKGESIEARQQNAQKIGRSHWGHAHIVLWGEISLEDGELYIQPELAIAQQPQRYSLVGEEITAQRCMEPEHLSLKKRLAGEIADIVILILGIAYYRSEELDDAVNILDQVKDLAGLMYSGFTQVALAHRSTDPVKHYRKAQSMWEQSLNNFDKDSEPGTWARLQNNLGIVYSDLSELIEGEEGNNYISLAVASYNRALEINTREKISQKWASIQNNLGNAYGNLGGRTEGANGIEYLFLAVTAFKSALEVRTREKLPRQWALTQNNLATVYCDLGMRVEGEAGDEQLYLGIEAYSSALEVCTRARLPQKWAGIQNNLATVYCELGGRVEGKRGEEYFSLAATAGNSALEIYTRDKFPQNWAKAQNNLGNVYSSWGERLEGTTGEKYLSLAVSAYNLAGEIRTRADLPQDWATTQNNLGNVFHVRGMRLEGAGRARYLHQAVNYYNSALEVRTRTVLPQAWAMTKYNIAGTLFNLSEYMGDGAAPMLGESLEYVNDALEVYTKGEFPYLHQKAVQLRTIIEEQLEPPSNKPQID
ncbi:tetratricopeptide repeat protein [Candidatus Neomarinimicrobiota bacterium]